MLIRNIAFSVRERGVSLLVGEGGSIEKNGILAKAFSERASALETGGVEDKNLLLFLSLS